MRHYPVVHWVTAPLETPSHTILFVALITLAALIGVLLFQLMRGTV